ncbi:MAG: glycoside hydrolase, partial [Chitinophagaceae bacterium]
SFPLAGSAQQRPQMFYSDTSRVGRPLAKDPKVIRFHDTYWMYYSIPANSNKGWGIGIATSNDLTNWKKVGEMEPTESYEAKGICAPGGLVRHDTLHLFYQTYGNGKNDAICHAWSVDGIKFHRDPSNPVFRPTGTWTCGRAIDAEVVQFKENYFMYFATRDTSYKIQMQGVAATSLNSSFSRKEWQQVCDSSILKPGLSWEKKCIEAASCIQVGGFLYMFYAGGYNNEPQQIGLAKSHDGIHWTRVKDTPYLSNGIKGSWNESESGHPDILRGVDGKLHLFFQGNNDKGRTWYLSRISVNEPLLD